MINRRPNTAPKHTSLDSHFTSQKTAWCTHLNEMNSIRLSFSGGLQDHLCHSRRERQMILKTVNLEPAMRAFTIREEISASPHTASADAIFHTLWFCLPGSFAALHIKSASPLASHLFKQPFILLLSVHPWPSLALSFFLSRSIIPQAAGV